MILERLMVIGGSGLLGGHLAKFLCDHYEVCATYLGHPVKIPGCKTIPMDIVDFKSTQKAIQDFNPDCIVLSAAQRDVDFCQRNQELASKINVEGAKNVSVASEKVQAKLIFISTDLVFDGEKGMYKEDDRTHAVNFYGKTKLRGEGVVAETLDDHAIARVSVIYDWNPFEHNTNFISWLYDNLRSGKPLSLFTDQFRCATYIKNACHAILKIYEKDKRGIFHVAGKNCENRCEIGIKVAQTFGFDKSLISKSESNKGDWIAKRPAKCCLEVGKMETDLGVRSMSVEEGLRAMKEEMDTG